MNDTARALHLTALSRHMTEDDIAILSRFVQSRVFQPDTVVYTEGAVADSLFIIAVGRVELCRVNDEGRREVTALLRNGHLFGEDMLLDNAGRDHSARCLDESHLYCLNRVDYRRMSIAHPRLAARLLGLLSDKLKREAEGEFVPGRSIGHPIVSFFSARGGVGKTFLAANYAAAAAGAGLSVALVELDLQLGNLEYFLGFAPVKTLWDIVANEDLHTVHPALLMHYGTSPVENLSVFFRPREITESEQIATSDIARLLDLFQHLVDLVVIDCRTGFNEITMTALDLSDKVYLVTSADCGGVMSGRQVLAVLGRLGYSSGKVRLLVNFSDRDRDITHRDRRLLFEGVTEAVLPYEGLVMNSLNSARLWIHDKPRHTISRELLRLARQLLADPDNEPESRKEGFLKKWLHWFGGGSEGLVLDNGPEGPAVTARHKKRAALSEFALGQAYFLVGKYDVASRAFERAIDQDKSLAFAYFYQGEIARFDQDEGSAKFYYQSALRHDPENLRYRVRLALLEKSPKLMPVELKAVLDECGRHPDYPDLRLLCAELYFMLGCESDAHESLDMALKLNPSYVEALTMRGMVFFAQRRPLECLRCLVSALAHNSNHIPALFFMGTVFCDLELVAFAQSSLQRVLDVHGAHRPSHRILLDLQDPIRVLRREVERYSEAAAIHPRFADFPFKLSLAYFQLGDFSSSLRHLARAKENGYSPAKVEQLHAKIEEIKPILEGSFLLPRHLVTDSTGGRVEAISG